jgi:hypothetical protein
LFAPLCGISLFAACSSDTTNYFDTPNPAAGKSAAGTGGSAAAAGGSNSDSGGAGGSKAGTGSEAGGSGGDKPSKGGTGNGGSSNPTGGTPNVGGLGGNTPNQGGTGNGGSTEGGMSGESGAGETGAGGTTGGTGGTQSPGGEGGMQGGMAGDPGGGGTGGAHVGGTGGTGAGTGGQPDACDADDDCATSEYCKKSSCDAAKGTCTEKPASCTGTSAALNPVCGCDHMTYYTACVAAQEGVNVASSGACGSGAATCNRIDGGSSCSPERARAACYRTRSTNSCNTGSPPNEGVCWVLPETCPTEETLELDCNNGGTPICRGLCDALEKNRPLIRNSNQCD